MRGKVLPGIFGAVFGAVIFMGLAGAEVREFRLEVVETTLEIAGVPFPVWAFNGTVPGPTLRVREGDLVRVTLVNKSRADHTIHFHGQRLPNAMDGVPHHGNIKLSQAAVKPGESFTYEFIAKPTGTHIYHCHVNSHEHIDMGMYGAFIVDPKEEAVKADREYVLMLDEWDSSVVDEKVTQGVGHPRRLGQYNFFTINGKAFPETEFLKVSEGEKVRLRVINVGYQIHSMHLHGHGFLITHKDGYPLANPIPGDTLGILPGERYDLLFTADNPGVWAFHDHVVPAATNDGQYPGGMITAIVYEPKKQAQR